MNYDDWPAHGEIIGHAETNTYTWEGPPIAWISAPFLDDHHEPGDLIELTPLIVCLHHYDPLLDLWEVYLVGSHGRLLLFLRDLIRFGDWLYRRLLLTAAVWGLACWPEPGTYPSWEDVRRKWRRHG